MLHIHHLAECVSPSVGMVCKAGHGYGCKCSACGRKGAKQAVARALQEMVKWEHPIGRFGREAQELAANLPQKRKLLVDSKDESAKKETEALDLPDVVYRRSRWRPQPKWKNFSCNLTTSCSTESTFSTIRPSKCSHVKRQHNLGHNNS